MKLDTDVSAHRLWKNARKKGIPRPNRRPATRQNLAPIHHRIQPILTKPPRRQLTKPIMTLRQAHKHHLTRLIIRTHRVHRVHLTRRDPLTTVTQAHRLRTLHPMTARLTLIPTKALPITLRQAVHHPIATHSTAILPSLGHLSARSNRRNSASAPRDESERTAAPTKSSTTYPKMPSASSFQLYRIILTLNAVDILSFPSSKDSRAFSES